MVKKTEQSVNQDIFENEEFMIDQQKQEQQGISVKSANSNKSQQSDQIKTSNIKTKPIKKEKKEKQLSHEEISPSEKAQKNKKNKKNNQLSSKPKQIDIKNKKTQIKSKKDSLDSQSDQFIQLQVEQVKFTNNIKMQKGWIFPQDMRKKLKIFFPTYNFTDEADYNPDKEQNKLKQELKKSLLWKYLTDNSLVQKYQNDFIKIRDQIMRASYIHCQEITHEYYELMRKVLDIVFVNFTKKEEKINQLRTLGDQLAVNQVPGSDFPFMSFTFVNKMKGVERRNQLDDKYRKKYTLNDQFKKKDGEFANYIKKCGDVFCKLIKELKIKNITPFKNN